MKFIELQEAFELETGTFEDGLNKIPSADIEYWLNNGLMKYIKTRYSGINFKLEGFELSQKRLDDLRTLIISLTYSGTNAINTQYAIVTGDYLLYSGINQLVTSLPFSAITNIGNNTYSVNNPSDYMVLLGTQVGIGPSDSYTGSCWKKVGDDYIVKYVSPILALISTINKMLSNSLSVHRLHYAMAQPIELQINDRILFHTDDNYKVVSVTLYYLKNPDKIDLHTTPFAEYTDMPEHTHMEIVKVAVLMYLENKKDPRYLTFANEVNTME